MSDPRAAATDFLRLAASTNVREAYRKYVGPNFRHHNAYFKGDAESLMRGMEENAKKNPQKTLPRSLEKGDFTNRRMDTQAQTCAVVTYVQLSKYQMRWLALERATGIGFSVSSTAL